jgi:hypothetical protein
MEKLMITKMDNARTLTLIVIGFAASLFGQSVRAAAPPVQVGGCKGKTEVNYPTIQAAVTAVGVGGTVNVCPGTYPEQVVINKSLTLLGNSNGNADNAIIVPPSGGMIQNATDPAPGAANPNIAAQIFVNNASTVTIKNIILNGANNGLSGCSSPVLVGIYFLNTAGAINGADVLNEVMDSPTDSVCNSGLGIYVEADNGPAVTLTISAVNNFQKNGITASGYGNGMPGPVMNIFSDNVAGQGPTSGALENGIQIGYGATGKVDSNIVSDLIWNGGSSDNPGAEATGILVIASNDVTVNSNRIATTQFAIAVVSDPVYGNADSNTVTVNYINNSFVDGIDICSNKNTIQNNDEYNSVRAGIHIDSTCTEGPGGGSSGNSNVLTKNNSNGACAGLLLGNGTGNTSNPQILIANVNFQTLAGNTCNMPLGTSKAILAPQNSEKSPHPLAFR